MSNQPMQGGWGQPPAQQQQYAQPQQQQGWGQPPAQQGQPQQNPWGNAPGQSQQQQYQGPPPVAATVADEFDDFFSGGVKGEPGFDWGRATNQQQPGKTAIGSNIAGIITEMVQMQQTDMATRAPKFYESGDPMMQVAITLQTDLRNWAGIMPEQVPDDPNTGGKKHPGEDTGLRRIYVKNDMKRAVTQACQKVGQKPRKGGMLAVQLVGYEDRKKGNPMPLYEAVYQPAPEDGGTAGFFAGQQASAPGQQAFAGQDTAPPQQPGQQFQNVPPSQSFPAPAQQGPPPGYAPPQGQGYAPEQGQQNPSTLGNAQAPQTPPDFAQPGYGQPPAQGGQPPAFDGPNF